MRAGKANEENPEKEGRQQQQQQEGSSERTFTAAWRMLCERCAAPNTLSGLMDQECRAEKA